MLYEDDVNCFPLEKRDSVACKEEVSGLRRLVRHGRVLLAHVVTELQVVILPGEASMFLPS